MMTNTTTATQLELPAMHTADDLARIRALRSAYVILGSDWHLGLAYYYALPPIVALSVAVLRSGRTRYRLATLADGSQALAESKGRGYSIALTAKRARI